MNEVWRRIPGASAYEISDRGQVRSWRPWRGLPTPRTLQCAPDGWGYVRTHLVMDDGTSRYAGVHVLLLEAFVGPRPPGTEVIRHLDGIKAHNWLSNLAYGTGSENNHDTVRHGHHPMTRKTHCIHGHEFTPENTIVKMLGGKFRQRACRICLRAAWTRQNRKRRAA